MRNLLIAAFLVCVAGCSQTTNESVLAVASSTQYTTISQSSTERNIETNVVVGTVASVKIDDNEREKNLNNRLHFCVFENGESDYIYVGTIYGMWSRGQFDLTIDGEKIFTGHVEHLVYEGIVIQMGDVLSEQPAVSSVSS